MTKAMQVGETNQIAPLKYIEVLFTILIGTICLDETYTLVGLVGVLLILIGLILNIVVKNLLKTEVVNRVCQFVEISRNA